MVGRKNNPPIIGFWAADENNFNFLQGIIDGLKQHYSIKVFTYDPKKTVKFRRELKSVDIAWLEWANGPVIEASKIAKKKPPIINRLHRYEAYTDIPEKVNYKNIDRLIFIAPGVQQRFKERFPDQYESVDSTIIENGIDFTRFKLKEKPITKQILYTGRIHEIKNPSLMLQIMAKLISIDPEYHMTMIGDFWGEVYEQYVYDQIDKLGLKGNITIHRHLPQEKLVEYMQAADFFLITSIIEGVSQASLEAMACGARPLISNYYGSKLTYPDGAVYNTIDEAVDYILNPRLSRQDSRRFVEENYTLEDKITEIHELIQQLLVR